MHTTISLSAFRDAFRNETFSYAGLRALFDYLEEIEPDTELDVVGIRCTYTEYDSLVEAARDYDLDPAELRDHTEVILCDNNHVIVAAF